MLTSSLSSSSASCSIQFKQQQKQASRRAAPPQRVISPHLRPFELWEVPLALPANSLQNPLRAGLRQLNHYAPPRSITHVTHANMSGARALTPLRRRLGITSSLSTLQRISEASAPRVLRPRPFHKSAPSLLALTSRLFSPIEKMVTVNTSDRLTALRSLMRRENVDVYGRLHFALAMMSPCLY